MSFVRRFRWPLIGIAGVLTVALLSFRMAAHNAKELALYDRNRAAHRPIPVRTELVSQQAVGSVVGGTALTGSSQQSSITVGRGLDLVQLNLIIQAVNVVNGQYVKADTPLFELEADQFPPVLEQRKQAVTTSEAALALAKASPPEHAKTRQGALDSATSDVAFGKSEVTYRQTDLERYTALRAQNQVTLHEYLEAVSAFDAAHFALSQAQQREIVARQDLVLGPLQDQKDIEDAANALATAKVALAQAIMQAERATLSSRVDGFVDGLTVVKGEIVASTSVLATVLRVDPIWVTMDYPQERIADLTMNQPAEVIIDSFPQEKFVGKVVRIPAVVNEKTRTLPVVIEVANPDHRIKTGISGYARLQVGRPATTIPAVSVISMAEKAMVFVVEQGKARIREIKLGPPVEPGYNEVLAGLRPGDEVVIYGQQYLNDGEPVNSNWRQWTRRN